MTVAVSLNGRGKRQIWLTAEYSFNYNHIGTGTYTLVGNSSWISTSSSLTYVLTGSSTSTIDFVYIGQGIYTLSGSSAETIDFVYDGQGIYTLSGSSSGDVLRFNYIGNGTYVL